MKLCVGAALFGVLVDGVEYLACRYTNSPELGPRNFDTNAEIHATTTYTTELLGGPLPFPRSIPIFRPIRALIGNTH